MNVICSSWDSLFAMQQYAAVINEHITQRKYLLILASRTDSSESWSHWAVAMQDEFRLCWRLHSARYAVREKGLIIFSSIIQNDCMLKRIPPQDRLWSWLRQTWVFADIKWSYLRKSQHDYDEMNMSFAARLYTLLTQSCPEEVGGFKPFAKQSKRVPVGDP